MGFPVRSANDNVKETIPIRMLPNAQKDGMGQVKQTQRTPSPRDRGSSLMSQPQELPATPLLKGDGFKKVHELEFEITYFRQRRIHRERRRA